MASRAGTHRRIVRTRLRRSSGDHVLTGAAGGIGERLGIDPVVVRLAFVVLAMAGGAGILLYLLALVVAAPPREEVRSAQAPRTSARQAFAVGLVVLGAMLLLREGGFWFGDGLVWPVALAVLGSAVIWTRSDEVERARLGRLVARLPGNTSHALAGKAPRLRLAAGVVLITGALVAFLSANRAVDITRNAPLAVAAAVTGLGVILGPWIWRLGRQLAEERRQRIRSEERAEVAAHLHDSVLQTLALIQRTGEPREMASLARAQERELRTWLYGRARAADHDLLSTAIDAAAAEVERSHRATIEVVTVGECRLDDGLRALVHACREAMINAAKHSGARDVSVYVEVEPDAVAAYVRDQGSGFDPDLASPDRRGISESIDGRMARNGGSALVVTAPGRGTEVQIRVPRRSA